MLNHGAALTHCTFILAIIQSKNKKWFKQQNKHATSNVYYRIFMKMSQISRFRDLFKKANPEYLISKTLFLAQLENPFDRTPIRIF